MDEIIQAAVKQPPKHGPGSVGAAIIHKALILERIAAGERITDIAQSLGYKDHSSISYNLAGDPEYKFARQCGAEARLDAREREIEQATESLTLARGVELIKHQRWRCEREFADIWADKRAQAVVNVQQNNNVAVSADDRDARIAELLSRAGK